MTTMTHPLAQFAERRHHPVTTAALVALFWMLAASLVVITRHTIDNLSSIGAIAVRVVIIATCAYAYILLSARRATVQHALFAGIAWVLLSIIAQIVTTQVTGTPWFGLIDESRSHGREVMLAVWAASPAAFVRYD